ncbi:MAG: NAD-dependent epimerase/dehydratase family protein [Mariniphaga sp.]
MLVMVTGANGLLGSYIVAELVKRKYKVRVLVRPGSDLSALKGFPVEYITGQLTKQEDVEKAVAGCTFVIHSAAMAIHKPTRLEAFRQINIESTRYVTEACIKYSIQRLVHVSTANCYVNGSKTNPGTEEGHFPEWMKKSGYAYSKYLAHQLVLEQVRKNRLNAVVVSPTFIIGKDVKPEGGRIFKLVLNKKIVFHPTGGKNFVDAGAAANGVINAMEKGKKGESYLLAGENLSYRQFFKMVKNITGQRMLLVPVPCFLLKLAGKAGDFCERVLNKPVELTHVNARMLCLGNYFTPAKAIREIDFPFVQARESIEKTIRWYKEHKS